jgi:carbon-monoxide dehydrogenase medium subunit
MMPRFAIYQPDSVDAAARLLEQYGEQARAYAGGVALLPVLKQGLLECEHLVDLKGLPGFRDIALNDGAGELSLGAGATHRQIERSALVRERFAALASLESCVGNIRVRGCGTIGGNLCFGEPDADPGVLLLVYGARVHLARSGTTRGMPLDDFFVGPFEVAIEPGEILTRIDVPPLPPRSAASYQRFGVLERPLASVAASVSLSADGTSFEDVRIAVGCAGPRPFRAVEAEQVLRDAGLNEVTARLNEASERAGSATEAVTDHRGSAAYKRHLVSVLTRRTVVDARDRINQNVA